MRITKTYGWAASKNLNRAEVLDEFKLLLFDNTLTDIPAGLKFPVYSINTNTALSGSYSLTGYRLIRDAILEALQIDKDATDINNYCDVQYPEAYYNSGTYYYSCVITRIVDSKASDATNRVYYLIGLLRSRKYSTSNSTNNTWGIENVILCESLGLAENERDLALSQWGKPIKGDSFNWDFNLPIAKSKIVSQSFPLYTAATNVTSNYNSGQYTCNYDLNRADNMYINDATYEYFTLLFDSVGSSFKVQAHIDDNGILSLIYTSLSGKLTIKKTRFPNSVLTGINSYTCMSNIATYSRFSIYVKGSFFGGIDNVNDQTYDALSKPILDTMNTVDELLAGPRILYNTSSTSQISTACVFGIMPTDCYIVAGSVSSTHNFTAGQLLQGNEYIYTGINEIILPWNSSVTWLSLSSS